MTATLNKPIAPIVKVVDHFCNLRCKYCFFHTEDQFSPRVMRSGLLERIVEQFIAYGKEVGGVRFVWHGGEPLLAGLDFFEEIICLQSKYNVFNCDIHNSVQTNGTLITEQWAEWFAKHNFGVGVSIDGSPKIHNSLRVNAGGGESWSAAIRGFHLLQKHGIDPGVLMVIHSQNALLADEAVTSLRSQGVNKIGFNPYFECDVMRDHSFNNELFLSPDNYSLFLKTIIDLWLEFNEVDFVIREIDNFVAMLAGTPSDICNFSGSCGNFVNIGVDGDVYPCEQIPHSRETRFGNILEQSIVDILQSPNRKAFLNHVCHRPDKCVSCEISQNCNNGCTHHRVNGEYYYCSVRKDVYSYLKARIGDQIDLLRQG